MPISVKSFNKRLTLLRSERGSFIPLWRELSDNHLGHRGHFLTSDRNKGFKKNTKQYNNTSRRAVRTLASGMMAGITSPARPWFRLGAPDPDLNEHVNVRQWLHDVQTIMYSVFSASNLYNSLHTTYSELGTFGTAAMGLFEDFDNVIWCKPYTIGSYMLGADGQNRIDTFSREYEKTVGQLVKDFSIDNVSDHVRNQWRSGNTEAWVQCVHFIEPNDDRDHISPLARDKKFRSVYYEVGRQCTEENKFLRRSGFDQFPIMTPRWDITGEDIYATDCPGMIALGDTKALQLGERRKFQALDKLVDPPMQAPTSMKNSTKGGSVRAGDIVWYDGPDKMESIYGNWRPDLNAMLEINREAEQRIKIAFYEDLFLMLSQSDRRQITAREVAEKHEEKLLMLGPVLERLHTELLDPLIDRTFTIAQDAGILPPPPPEMNNIELRVEYISVLAQAQQLVSVGAIERVGGFVGNLAALWPEARHKFNSMQAVDDYAEAVGVSPNVLRSDDEANALDAVEKQAAAQQAAMESGQNLVNTAKTASDIDLEEDNALSTTMRNAGLI